MRLSQHIDQFIQEEKKEIAVAKEAKEKKDAQYKSSFPDPHCLRLSNNFVANEVQYHFHELKEAKQFISILNQNYNINPKEKRCAGYYCNSTSTHCSYVAINEKQLDTLYGKGSFLILANIKEYLREDQAKLCAALNKASPAVASLAFYLTDALLAQAAAYLNTNEFIELLKKIDKEIIKKRAYFYYKNYDLSTLVTQHHSPEAFLMLLNMLGTDEINRAANFKKTYWDSLPIMVAKHHNSEVFLQLLRMLNEESICTASVEQFDNGWTLPAAVACYQNSEAFVALLTAIPPHLIGKAAFIKNKFNKNMLDYAANKQPAPAFNLLLRCLHENGREHFKKYIAKQPQDLFSLLRNVILFQSAENIKLFLELFDKDHLPELQKIFENFSLRKDRRLVIFAAQDKLSSQAELKAEGYSDIYKHIFLYDRLKPLGVSAEQKLNPKEQTLLDIFDQGEAYIKIIRADVKGNHADFLRQLKDPTYRPNLRLDKNRGHKLVLGTKTIVKERTDADTVRRKKMKKHTTAKKSSFTKISKRKHTGLFGYHDQQREMVGYVCASFNAKQIKARAREDFGSREHGWISAKRNDVMAYANLMQNIFFADAHEFDQHIDAQPGVCNEVLAKPSAANVQGIVIAKDTPRAREIAVERQIDFHAELGELLPICFYDPEAREVSIFPEGEQSKIYIAILKKQINLGKTSFMNRLFGSNFEINIPGFIKSSISDAEAAQILMRIAEYEREPYLINREGIIKKIFLGEKAQELHTPSFQNSQPGR